MTRHATGTFEVKLTPKPSDANAEGGLLGRMTVAKQIHGDLEATSAGEMLTAGTAVKDSAAYVAFEQVTGTLHGRRGSFILMHHATMVRGDGHLTVTVVPESGTGELVGLEGSMSIAIDGGKHSYVFDYTLNERR